MMGVGILPNSLRRSSPMAHPARAKSRRRPRPHAIHKPNGVLHPRVQAVGPERFGILSIDCAKARSKIMLADFYGRVLVPPTVIAHNQAGMEAAVRIGRKDRTGGPFELG